MMKKDNNNRPTYSKQIIDIADYTFENPNEKVQSVVALFCTKLHKCERTIKSYIKQAKQYNQSRLQKQENIKDEVLSEQTKEAVKSAIRTRNELLEKYWWIIDNFYNVMNGNAKAKKIGNQLFVITASDVLKAGSLIQKMEGWEAPAKTAQTDSKGNDITVITPEEAARFVKEMTKTYSKE